MVAGLVWLLPATALAQRFQARAYSESDGLPSTAVFGIGQDAHGRMLFLSRSAISRFDGVSWSSLDCGLRVSDTYHRGMLRAPDGTMWTADGGAELRLFHLDDRDCWQQVPPAPFDGQKGVVPTAVAILPGVTPTTVAIGTTTSDVAVWNGRRWVVVALAADAAQDGGIRGLVGLPDGRLTAATANGLFTLDTETGSTDPWRPDGLPEGELLALTVDPDEPETLWVLGASWLARVRDSTAEIITATLPVAAQAHPAVIQPDGLGTVVVVAGVASWLVDVESGEATPFDTTSGLGSLGIDTVFLDHERNIWCGGGRGVTRIGDRRIVTYSREHGLLEDEVTAVVATSNGEMALGHPTGVSVLAGRNVVRTVQLPAAPGNRVMDLAEDVDGNLWIADATGGLGRLRPDGQLEWVAAIDPLDEVNAVTVHPDLGLVVGTGHELLTMADGRLRPLEPRTDADGARRIVVDASGRLTVATIGAGLAVLADGVWRTVTSPDEPEANQVYTVAGSDPVWVGTRAGLFWADDDVLRRPLEPELVLRRPVFMLLVDRSNRLWIGTDHGLFRWDGERLVRFSTATGLAGNELNRAAALEDAAGHLWFGTDRGLSCYRPELDGFTPDPPRVGVIRLDTGDGVLAFSEPIALPAGSSTLTFMVQPISWIDERAIEVRSRLVGFDAQWQNVSSTVSTSGIRYTNLPPGDYHLEVQARSPTRDWGPAIASPTITLEAPIWRQAWFPVVLGMSVIAGSGAVAVAAQRRRRAALTDSVTGELNREGLRMRLERSLRRPGDGRFGLLVVRVDRFEAVIASLGHGDGDTLLAQAAARLRRRLPDSDIGRLEGSTFGVLFDTDLDQGDDTPIHDVQLLLALPYAINGHQVVSSVTCGVVVDSGSDTDPEHVLRDAIAALRFAADEGSGSRRVFHPEIREQALRALQLEVDLRRALEGDELELEYQPIVESTGDGLLGFEALLRWRHPQLGLLSPDDFLAMAESTGLVVPLGNWALHHAAVTHAELLRSSVDLRDTVVHVNLHVHQLGQGDIVAEVHRALDGSGLEPQSLSLELTEQSLMRHPRQAALTLGELRRTGVGLCLDDFGTGHSSLALLRRFSVDTLKIDRSFVADLGSAEGLAIVAAITQLARVLDLSVIAEGVETVEQLERLRPFGCRGLQGFLLARPMPVPELREWLAARVAAV